MRQLVRRVLRGVMRGGSRLRPGALRHRLRRGSRWPFAMFVLFGARGAAHAEFTADAYFSPEQQRTLAVTAEAGSVEARAALGKGLAENVPDELPQAVWWYLQAAELGDVDAQYALAKMFAQGVGVASSWTVADKWMILAAKAGNVDARADRPHLEGAMTFSARISAAQAARNWTARPRLGSAAANRVGVIADTAANGPGVADVMLAPGAPLAGVVPFVRDARDSAARTQRVALLGNDYRAEFIYSQAKPGFEVITTTETLAEWDFFSNFHVRRDGERRRASTRIGTIEYQPTVLEDRIPCLYFMHTWPSGHSDFDVRRGASYRDHDDRVLAGYLCGRAHRPLSDDEIARFFTNLEVRDTSAD